VAHRRCAASSLLLVAQPSGPESGICPLPLHLECELWTREASRWSEIDAAVRRAADLSGDYAYSVPRVSLITPAHEAERHVADAIASAIAQTFTDWEMIVADDASVDDTSGVAGRVEDERVRVVRSEHNLGPAGARNLALAHARGELVAFLDADDRLLPRYLETMVGLYDVEQGRRGDVGIVACDATIVGPEGPRGHSHQALHGFPDGASVTDLLRANSVFVCALSPSAVVEQVGGFSDECRGSEDHDLWLRILQSGRRIVATREILVLYNDAGVGLSRDPAGMARTTQATYRRALRRGGLTREQRRIAGERLRVARAVEATVEIAAQRRAGAWKTLRNVLRASPALLAAALTDPRRWPDWLRGVRLLMAREP
jgi:GT2 family glycosyltransferase